MRILVTGVAGHIGSALAAHALSLGHQVVGVDDLSCGYPEQVPAGTTFLECDAGEIAPEWFDQRFDAAFHCAAYAAECLSPFVRKFNYASNVVTTAGLVNRLVDRGGHGRLVLFSSIAVYGRGAGGEGDACFSEWDPTVPNDPYGVAKLACEHDVRIAGEQHGLDWCVLRPHNVYGPGQSIWQKYRNVFGLWARATLEGRPLTVFGDGEQRRAFSYVDDVVPCAWEAAFREECSKETINLGGSQPTRIVDAARAFQAAVGSGRLNVHHEPARHEVRDAWCTVGKSKRLLGYEDRTSLADGLEKTWRWASEAWEKHPERRDAPDSFELEVARGVPPSWLGSLRRSC